MSTTTISTIDRVGQPVAADSASGRRQVSLVDLLDRLLGAGVVLSGDITISIAGVDLVEVRLRALITSVRAEMRATDPSADRAPSRGSRTMTTLPQRIESDKDSVERDLFKLVLTIVELVRQLMERQAIRRVDEGDLSDDQIEEVGTALMKLESAVTRLRELYDLTPDELNLDLGPLGRLLAE
ncbi:gas vesicle protein GvpJ [Microlunatus sp. Gsoil 973]|uniref:gas vesicle protein GvpJ n=1 Tax=Microlunatus sp. Gsoil 973 TaxID=2672569 RepID=UPI0012B45C3E|nr:gas vesicle protein GvpJ [Microlunatus sp. Gsoil 973]QGN31966.1 gas vesicle protein K [Microlunatus sp. Gsoil 973]